MDYDANCIFCKIANHKVGELEYEKSDIVVFKDIQPKAKIHLLITPKRHILSLNETGDSDQNLLGDLFLTAKQMAKEFNLKNGYRLVINTGPDSGQAVQHLHLHLLGGQKLKGDL